MFSRLFFIPTLLISIFSLPLSSYLPSPLRGQPGHIVRLVALTSFAPVSPFPSRYRSFFPIYLLPLLPPSPSASPLLRPCCLSRCLPKVAWPNVAAPFVDITQSGCHRHVRRLLLCVAFALLPSLRAVTMSRLRFWCRLCWWMLWITWHAIVSWHSPHYLWFSFPHHKLATLLFGACLSSFSSITQKRWAMWDQPVAYCPARPPMPFSSSQIPRLGSIISIL